MAIAMSDILSVWQRLKPQDHINPSQQFFETTLRKIYEKTVSKYHSVMENLNLWIQAYERKLDSHSPSLLGRFLYAFGAMHFLNPTDKEIFATREHLNMFKFYKDKCEEFVTRCCIKEERKIEYTKSEKIFMNELFYLSFYLEAQNDNVTFL